jgi:hypothetical protein
MNADFRFSLYKMVIVANFLLDLQDVEGLTVPRAFGFHKIIMSPQ